MKKRISLLLALITVIAAMVLVLSFSASAATDPVHTTAATADAYAEIYTSSGTVKATLSDVSSGVAAFFAKAGDGDSIHLYKDFTTAEQIWIYGSVLFDGNNHKITSTNTDCAIKMANTEKDTGWKNSKSDVTGDIDTLRVKNLGLYSTTAHGFMFYCSSVLSLEEGNDININTTAKNIVFSGRNGGKLVITGGTYTSPHQSPISFSSNNKSGDKTYDVWTEWEIGGTWVFTGVGVANKDGSLPWAHFFAVGNANRKSLTFNDVKIVNKGSNWGGTTAINCSATNEASRVDIDGAYFEGFGYGAYAFASNAKLYLTGDISGKNTNNVVYARTGTIYATDANITNETKGKVTVNVGSAMVSENCYIEAIDAVAVNVGSGATYTDTDSEIATVVSTGGTKKLDSKFGLDSKGTLVLDGTTISSEVWYGMRIAGGTATLDWVTVNCTAGADSASADDGNYYGALTVTGAATVTATDCIFSTDVISNGTMPVRISAGATITFEDCEFNGKATPYGSTAQTGTLEINNASAKVTFKGEITGTYSYIRGRAGTITLDGATTKKIDNDVKDGLGTAVRNVIIKNGSTVNGNIYTRSTDTLSISGSTVNGGVTADNGATITAESTITGTLTVTGADLTITDSTVGQVKPTNINTTITNSTLHKAADNTLCITGGTVTVTGGSITSTSEGCPVAIDGAATVTLTGVTIGAEKRSTVEVRGEGAKATIDKCTLTSSQQAGGTYAIIRISGKNASATVTDTTGTAANSKLFNISAEGASATVTGSDFAITNTGSGYPGIQMEGKNASVTLTDTTLTAQIGQGILLAGEGASATIEDSTITTLNANVVLLKGNSTSFTMISGILKVASGGNHTIYSTGIKTTTTVYDGYVINEGTGRAYSGSPKSNDKTDGGDYANLTVYGGHFIVFATNGCTNTYNYATVEGFDNGSYFYGGQVYNFQSQAEKGYSFGAAQNVKKKDYVQVLNLKTITTSVNSLYNDIVMNKDKNQLALKAGAQVRIVDDGTNGIRFVSDIPKATLDLVAKIADGGTYTYGTAIVPTKFLTENGLKAFSITALEQLGKTVLKIQATEKGTVKNADGSVTLNAALIGMSDAQLKLAYSAMPYIEYTVDGHTVYMCGVYDAVDHTRTIADVAERALVDVRATAGWDDVQKDYYNTEVEINGQIWYSCYDEDQLKVLKQYAAVDGTGDDYAGLAVADDGTDNIANAGAILE